MPTGRRGLLEPNALINTCFSGPQNFRDRCELRHVNILAQLYMNEEWYQETVDLINRAGVILLRGTDRLPLDLEVKAGMCLAFMNEPGEYVAQASLPESLTAAPRPSTLPRCAPASCLRLELSPQRYGRATPSGGLC